jgi:hypothetical protein
MELAEEHLEQENADIADQEKLDPRRKQGESASSTTTTSENRWHPLLAPYLIASDWLVRHSNTTAGKVRSTWHIWSPDATPALRISRQRPPQAHIVRRAGGSVTFGLEFA